MRQGPAALPLPQQVQGEPEERQGTRLAAGVGKDAVDQVGFVVHPGDGIDGSRDDLPELSGAHRPERVDLPAEDVPQAGVGEGRLQEIGAQRGQHPDGGGQLLVEEDLGELVDGRGSECEQLLELVHQDEEPVAPAQLEEAAHQVGQPVSSEQACHGGNPFELLRLGQFGFQQRQQRGREGRERVSAGSGTQDHGHVAGRSDPREDSRQGQRGLARSGGADDGGPPMASEHRDEFGGLGLSAVEDRRIGLLER